MLQQALSQAGQQAAMQDLEQTGGQGIEQLLGGMGGMGGMGGDPSQMADPAQLQAMEEMMMGGAEGDMPV